MWIYTNDDGVILATNENDMSNNTGWQVAPGEIPGDLYDGRGIARYKLAGGEIVQRSAEEMNADDKGGEDVKTPELRIAALEVSQAVASIAFVTMAEAGQIDAVTAGEHADAFAPWASGVKYTVGQIRTYGGKLYSCVQAHTSQDDWTPDVSASLWKLTADPSEEWPEWSQPVGAHDAYSLGDKVSHNGQHWRSTADNNVWEPGSYGWEAASE